jgi:hypothetical protein
MLVTIARPPHSETLFPNVSDAAPSLGRRLDVWHCAPTSPARSNRDTRNTRVSLGKGGLLRLS